MNRLTLDDVRICAEHSPQITTLSISLANPPDFRSELRPPPEWKGKIRGPFCLHSKTLTANYSLRAEATAPSATVAIPDFCHWTPDLPFTYELEFQLWRGGEVDAEFRERIALGRIELQSGRLYRSGKRWIPRIARLSTDQIAAIDFNGWLEQIRANDLALAIPQSEASPLRLAKCQEIGVALAIEGSFESGQSLRCLESSGCVFMLLTEQQPEPLTDTRLLVASHIDHLDEGGIQRWKLRSASATTNGWLAAHPSGAATAAISRGLCDALQARVAHERDWAGFLV